MRRKLVWAGVALVALLAAGAAAVLFMADRPMYEPGQLTASGVDLEPPRSPPEPGFFQVTRDVRLAYFAEGAGRNVLVVHGGPGFPHQRPWAAGARLADAYRLVYVQQRGCAGSTRPITKLAGKSFYQDMKELESSLGLGAQVADLERVRRLLGDERLPVIGHSFGALIAALYAVELPERVASLVLVAPAPLVRMPPAEGQDLFSQVAARLPPADAARFEPWRRELFDLESRLRESDAELAERYARFGTFYAQATGVAIEPLTGVGGLMPFGIFLSMGRRHDWRAAMKRVRVPVLVLHGARDLQPEAQSREVAGYFETSRFVVIPDAGHFVFDDAPEAFARAVRELLE
jgi:proline iminopeptidase